MSAPPSGVTGAACAYLFAQDLHDEGIDPVLDRLQGAGLNGAIMAAAYHHARDVFPHNPQHKVIYLEGGAVFFHPDPGRYGGTRLQPHVAALAREADPLATLVETAARRSMRVGGWVVFLHNSRLAFQHPDCAPVNAFGDPLLNSLCPAHPEVRAFARALGSDVARYHLHTIQLEALSYMPFDHGYHHERSFIRLSPNVRFLLGLCFCTHCLAAARAAGVDGERVRERVRAAAGAVFDSAANETQEPDVEERALRADCDGELGRFLDVRQTVVTSLVEEVVAAIHAESPETRAVFLDPSGATLGYATGRPATERSAASIAWRDGVDLAVVAGASDGLGILAYFADLERFEREVGAYQRVLPVGRSLEALLRPMLPDAESPRVLAAKITSLRQMGVRDISFYHYGFMRLESLDWIRVALGSGVAHA
jgi:hypothetical protein